jgi:hemerythrin HHE cation binding domain-containing protein
MPRTAREPRPEQSRAARDCWLRKLPSDHDRERVLARRIASACDGIGGLADAKEAIRALLEELEPKLCAEEESILPGLEEQGDHELVVRTRREHATLRALIHAATSDAARPVLRTLADLLEQYLCFEEQLLRKAVEGHSARQVASG